jgi:hypothetical protein
MQEKRSISEIATYTTFSRPQFSIRSEDYIQHYRGSYVSQIWQEFLQVEAGIFGEQQYNITYHNISLTELLTAPRKYTTSKEDSTVTCLRLALNTL